jgi:hypothetical protein
MRRRLLIIVLIFLVLVGSVGVSLFAARHELVAWTAERELAARGFHDVALTVEEVGWSRVRLTGLTAGRDGELKLESILLLYRGSRLLRGEIDELRLTGLTLRLDLTGTGPPLGSLQAPVEALLAEDGGSRAPSVAAPRVLLESGLIAAETALGPIRLDLEGRVEPQADRLDVTLALAVSATRGRLLGRLRAQVAADGGVAGGFRIDQGSLTLGETDLTAQVAPGGVQFAWRDGQIEAVTGELAFDAVELSGEDWGSAALSLEATPVKISARGELGSGAESFRLHFSAVLEDFLAKATLGAIVSLTADATAPLWRFLPVTRPSAGDINLEMAIEGGLPDGQPWSRDPGTLPEWISGAALTAEALLRLDGLALPEIADKLDAWVPVTARLEGRVLDLALSADADAEAAGVSRQFLERNGLLPDLLGDRLSLKLFATGEQPFSARLSQNDTGRGLAVSGKARLSAQDRIDLAATGGVEVALDQALRLRHLTFQNVALAGTAGTLPGTPVTALSLTGDLSGSVTGALESGEGADQAGITHDIRLKVSSLQAKLRRQEAPPLRITGAADFGLSGAVQQDGSYRGQGELSRGRIELPDLALAVDGLAADVPLTAAPPAIGAIGFSAQGIRDLAEPARFHPMALSGKMSPAGRALDLVAEVTAAEGAAQVNLAGRHDLDSARGHLDAILGKAEFRPGEFQPTALSPLLDTFHDVLGPIEAKARFEWSPDGIRGTADLASNGLSFEVDGVRFDGLAGELRLDRLDPLHSPAGQRLTAERIDLGLSLEEVDVTYQLLPGTPVLARVQQAEFATLGGRYRVGETLIDPARAQQELTLQVVDLDLAKLFEQIDVEGLSGTGHLGGTLPLSVGRDGVTVSKARLKAQAPGVLRFSSATAAAALESGGESVALMLQALEDFHYDRFTVRASKQAAGETSLRIRLQGQNPEVLDGHPFKFNINLSGNLGPVLAALTQGRALSNKLLGGAWKLEP